MDELKKEFDDTALEIMEFVEQSRGEVEQLHQLQKLLKNIGVQSD